MPSGIPPTSPFLSLAVSPSSSQAKKPRRRLLRSLSRSLSWSSALASCRTAVHRDLRSNVIALFQGDPANSIVERLCVTVKIDSAALGRARPETQGKTKTHLPPDELERSDPCRYAREFHSLNPSLWPRPRASHVSMLYNTATPWSTLYRLDIENLQHAIVCTCYAWCRTSGNGTGKHDRHAPPMTL